MKHHRCRRSKLISPSCRLPLLTPSLLSYRRRGRPRGEHEEVVVVVVAASKARTETLVLLCVPDWERGSTGDGEPLSRELQALNRANSQG